MRARASLTLALLLVGSACRQTDFVYEHFRDATEVRQRYEEYGLTRDLIVIVDNSPSMRHEEARLLAPDGLLSELHPFEGSWRLGIASTDVYGAQVDCSGAPMLQGGAMGNCEHPEIELRRPHDGVAGRLIAAFDPAAFDVANYPSVATLQGRAAFAQLAPKSAAEVPWIIDTEAIARASFAACGCAICGDAVASASCLEACAAPVADALYAAQVRSAIGGLGLSGSPYESGLAALAYALGIDPAADTVEEALAPSGKAEQAVELNGSWQRQDAGLGLFVESDEDDCSGVLPTGQPAGIDCYGSPSLWQPAWVAELVQARASGRRLAVEVETGLVAQDFGSQDAVASDCVSKDQLSGSDTSSPPCACIADEGGAASCTVTTLSSGAWLCDAVAAPRYLAFSQAVPRGAWSSICGFGPWSFANFNDMPDVRLPAAPVDDDSIQVRYVSRFAREAGCEPAVLPEASRTDPEAVGWYYDEYEVGLHLFGMQLHPGDVLEVSVLVRKDYSF